MELFLVPLLGPFHVRMPRYNAVTVRDVVAELAPDVLATSALPPGAFEDPSWRDTEEIALPLSVQPWARRRGLSLVAVGEDPPDPAAEADMRRYLQQAGAAETLQPLEAVEAEVREALQSALDARRVDEVLSPRLARLHATEEELFGDGPGTGWRRQRAQTVAARVRALDGQRVVLLAPVEDVPLLHEALDDAQPPPRVAASDEARRRALLDTALRGDASEPGALLQQLRELEAPEARLAEADLLLAHGHAAEALETLEAASHRDFQEPYYLPGWLLARLGQLFDLAGRREDARRAYRGVLALSWAPAATREAARAGLQAPFEPPTG